MYYEFNVVDSLCHNVVIGRNLLTVIRSEVSLPGGGIEVFCGNPISSCEYVPIPPGNECIIPVAPWHPMEPSEESIYCSSAVTAPVIVESCINARTTERIANCIRPLLGKDNVGADKGKMLPWQAICGHEAM